MLLFLALAGFGVAVLLDVGGELYRRRSWNGAMFERGGLALTALVTAFIIGFIYRPRKH